GEHRPVGDQGLPPVPLEEVRDPGHVLLETRLVQPQVVLVADDVLRADPGVEGEAGGRADRYVHHDEDEDARDEEDWDRVNHSPDDVPKHLAPSPSGTGPIICRRAGSGGLPPDPASPGCPYV